MELTNLNPRIVAALKRSRLKRVSVQDLLSYSIGDLQRLAQLTADEAVQAVRAASQVCSVQPQSALSLLKGSLLSEQATMLSTGCLVLDDFLRGGLPVQGLVEVSGESSAGKTQLCLQLCLAAQLPRRMKGLSGAAVYVSTEDVFPHKRLAQMTEHFPRKVQRQSSMEGARLLKNCKLNFMDRVYVEHALTLDDLEVFVERRLSVLFKMHEVRLVVIDSVAALARAEFSQGQEIDRVRVLSRLASNLRRFSREHNVVVIMVNQVSAVIGDQCTVKPALGLAWSDMLCARLLLSRFRMPVQEAKDCLPLPVVTVSRQLQVLLAPHLPPSKVSFVVDETGVSGVQSSETYRNS